MIPLGFRFDVDAVIVAGTAQTEHCVLVPAALPPGAVRIADSEIYRSERCPRECRCAPPFETLLSYQLEPASQLIVS